MSRSPEARERRKQKMLDKFFGTPEAQVKQRLRRHAYKDKFTFLNEEDVTIWLAGKPGLPPRLDGVDGPDFRLFGFYRCDVCPYWHVTLRGLSSNPYPGGHDKSIDRLPVAPVR